VSTGRWTWLDLRLVPAAAVSWLAALASPRVGSTGLFAVAAGAVLLAVALSRRPGPAGFVVIGVLTAFALSCGAAGLRNLAREASPLHAVAERRGTVEVQLTLDDLPRVVSGAGPQRVVAAATVTAVRDGRTVSRVDDGVLLFAPATDWADLQPGQPVRVRATAMLPRDAGLVAVVTARGPPRPAGTSGWVQAGAQRLRQGLAEASARVLGSGPGGLLPGLVVGDTSAMDPVLTEDFRRTGLSHLTAVSGANVSIAVAGVLWPLRRRAVDRRVQAVVGTLALVGFVVLTGPGASVLRAAAMGLVTLVALASGRQRAAVPALCAGVLVLLLVQPALAADLGFALSVAATAAIVLLAPTWSRAMRRRGIPAPVADAVAVSAAAGLATAPLIAAFSGQVSLVSLPANLLAAAAVAPATVLGLLAALVAPLAAAPADVLVWLAGWPVRWLIIVAQRGAAMPDAVLTWPAGTAAAVVLTLALVAAGMLLWRFRRLRALALAAVVGMVMLGWPLRQAVRGWPPSATVVVACDVGQGDALVVPTGPGEGLLVDTGPDVAGVDSCLTRLGIDRLRLVLLSHLDADHAGGLAGALAGRHVDTVATGTLSPADDRVGRVNRLAAAAGARRETLVPGQIHRLGDATLEVLAPPPEIATASAAANDLSVVARVTVHGVRVLFTGDLGAEAEARILDRGVDLSADVLKVPHHGSADVDPEFLAATGARVALVSVGADNDYGHPTAYALRLLGQDGMRIERTDRDGDVAVVGDARSWGVAARERRRRVTPCRRGSGTPGTDLPPPGRGGGGGAAASSRRLRCPCRGARAPPRRRDPRARRRRPAGRAAGRRPRALAVRRPPARPGQRRARGRHGSRRRPRRLRQGPRSRAHARDRALRRQAQRGAAQGLHRRRGRGRRLPQDHLPRRPSRLRAQRGALLGRADHPRRAHRAGRRRRQRPAPAVLGRQSARLRLRRHHRRRRGRPVPPRSGRGERVHRRGEGAGR
jgi:competence protein ComEC